MPLKKGHSKEVVGSNIREMVGAGHPVKQAVAASLAKARKYKNMKDGGWSEGEDESADEIIEDSEHTPFEEQHLGQQHPSEVANPETQDFHRKFFDALTDSSLEDKEMGELEYMADGGATPNPSPEPADYQNMSIIDRAKAAMQGIDPYTDKKKPGYAGGGLVQEEFDDEPLGNKPEPKSDGTEEPMSSEPYKPDGLEHKKEGSPKRAMGINEETMNVINERKKNRRFYR